MKENDNRPLTRGSGSEHRSSWIILAVTLTCVGLFAQGFDYPFGQSMSCLIASILLLGTLLIFDPSKSFWREIRIPLALIVLAISWVLGVAAVRALGGVDFSDLPVAPDLFLPKFLSTVGGVGYLLIGRIVGGVDKERNLAVLSLAVIITTFSLLGICLMLFPEASPFADLRIVREQRFMGLTGNANVTASVCGAGVLLCAGHGASAWIAHIRAFFADQDKALDKRAVIFLIGLAINGTALALTASRVAVLATFCSVVLLCLATKVARNIRLRDRITVTTAIATLAAGAIYFMPDLLSQRVSAFESDAHTRWNVYQRFWEMTQAAPWTGFGPGAFPQVNIYFMRDVSIHMRDMWIFNSPHSVLLQLWFVGGLPYVILIIAAAVLIARDVLTRRRWRHVGNRDRATVMSIAVIFAVGLIDIPLDVPASADLALLLVGLAWACASRICPRPTSSDDPVSRLKGLARPSARHF